MKATRFMRIPFFVTGYQVTHDNMDAIARWCEGYVVRDTGTPFVRVPVNRPTNKRQTEAHPGTWVIVSVQRGERSFKVYAEEWLRKQFLELSDEPEDEGIPDSELPPEFETRTGITRELNKNVLDNVRNSPPQPRSPFENPSTRAIGRAELT